MLVEFFKLYYKIIYPYFALLLFPAFEITFNLFSILRRPMIVSLCLLLLQCKVYL